MRNQNKTTISDVPEYSRNTVEKKGKKKKYIPVKHIAMEISHALK